MTGEMRSSYCGHCGRPLGDGSHETCARRLELEPPRFCPGCGRRMKVQVTPRGWTAVCVEHGASSSESQGSTTAP